MYVKLFSRILKSTINEEAVSTRWTWITCLLMADESGHFSSTPQGIAREANLSVEQVNTALEILTRPDPNSSTELHEGRRLIRCGSNDWQVVNYEHYRRIASREDDRNAARIRMRNIRAGEKPNKSSDVRSCSDVFDPVTAGSICSASEEEAYTEAEGKKEDIKERKAPADTSLSQQTVEKQKKADPLKRVQLDTETWQFSGFVDDDWIEWELKYPHVNIRRELERLVTYCQEKPAWCIKRVKGGRWLATINAWLLRAQERAENNPKAVPVRSQAQTREERLAQLASYVEATDSPELTSDGIPIFQGIPGRSGK